MYLKRIVNDVFFLPFYLSKEKFDVYHIPKNTGGPVFCSVPIIVTIHDIIPNIFSKTYLNNYLERLYYEIAIRVSIYRSTKIITRFVVK